MSDPSLTGLSLAELVAKARAGTLVASTLTLTAPQGLERPTPDSSPGVGTALLAQQAPSGSPLAVELIQARDLAELASRLSRSKNEFKQSTGRALLKAISGQVWAPKGHRNNTAYQIAAECVEAYPNLDPASAVQCFSAAISNANEQGSGMTLAKWAGMITRVQHERQLRLNMVAQVAPLLSATGRALEAQAKLATPQTSLAPPALEFAAPVYPSGALAPVYAEALGTPIDTLAQVVHSLVILADGLYYLRRPEGTHYPWKLKSAQALRVELARQFGVNNQTVITHDEKGSPLPVDELLLLYGSNAHRIVYDYSSPRTTWDAPSETLLVGFPCDVPAMHPDPAVHDWLCALAGATGEEPLDASISDLYDWISACTREHINKPSTALCIIGPPDAGKGVLVRAIAKTWGCLPVKLANAVERFNGSLLNSPVWHADERTPEGLTDDLFRTIVQERERLIEPKGREKVELRGCGRLVFTLNDPSDFQVGAIAGPEALQAVADRVSYFDCRGQKAALALTMAPLMLPDGDMDLPRIVRHLRWVQETYTPRSQRFLGAREDRSKVSDFVVRQMAANYQDVYERILEYLIDPASWENQYHADRRTFDDGLRYPIVTSSGGLWVWQTELAKRMGADGREAGRLRAALKAITSANTQREISFGPRGKNVRGSFLEIDLDRFVIAANVIPDSDTWRSVIQTVSVETRVRKPDQ